MTAPLDRYDADINGYMGLSSCGGWVRFDDYEAALAAARAEGRKQGLREAASEAAGEVAAHGIAELSPFVRRRILALIPAPPPADGGDK